MIDKWIKKFIWSGNINVKKVVTVAWSKVCRPTNEGGLGLRSFKTVNKAGLLKLAWDFCTSNLECCSLIKARTFKNNSIINYHISSSIWTGIKHYYSMVLDNSVWNLGFGDSISFWSDKWISGTIGDIIGLAPNVAKNLKARLCDFIIDGSWSIPIDLVAHFLIIKSEVDKVVIPVVPCADRLMWDGSSSGKLSFKDAYNFFKDTGTSISWNKSVWKSCIAPTKSFVL